MEIEIGRKYSCNRLNTGDSHDQSIENILNRFKDGSFLLVKVGDSYKIAPITKVVDKPKVEEKPVIAKQSFYTKNSNKKKVGK